MQLNDPQGIAQSPTTQNYLTQNASSAKVGNSFPKLRPLNDQPMYSVDMAVFLGPLPWPFFFSSLYLISLLGNLILLELETDILLLVCFR